MSASASIDQAREALRRDHGVRLVTEEEEGASAHDLPPGVYGFTNSPVLASPLFAVRRYRNFEVHRLAQGPAVVGFVDPRDAEKLIGNSGAAVEVRVFPDREGDVSTIVSIPYARIVQHRQYSVRNADAVTLHILPATADLVAT
jgi:hypothetical protein